MQQSVEYVVTLFRGRRAMVKFTTTDLNQAKERIQEWNSSGEGHTATTETREMRQWASGGEALNTEYLTQVN